MIEKPPILITGTSRAGAGMVAGVFKICGAFGGNMTNKRGLNENDSIREKIIKPYLAKNKVDPQGQYPLLDMNKDLWIPKDFKTWICNVMIEEGYIDGPWMYKDSRSSLIWPLWNYAFPDAKWVIVRRKPSDIIQSCMKTAYMNAFENPKYRKDVGATSEEESWLWWIHEHEKRHYAMIAEGINCKFIWPERMLHGDYKQLYDTLEWLGLPWRTEVLTYIDPLLWRSRKKERSA